MRSTVSGRDQRPRRSPGASSDRDGSPQGRRRTSCTCRGLGRSASASRSAERAQAFADEHGLERAYGSYAEIIADPDIDVLYIATPHPQHHAIALAAIEAGKAVLVEKTFTATVAGAEEIAAAARARGRVRHGGHVDPFPAGDRRGAAADRRRRDR